jgi:hypothetical protein
VWDICGKYRGVAKIGPYISNSKFRVSKSKFRVSNSKFRVNKKHTPGANALRTMAINITPFFLELSLSKVNKTTDEATQKENPIYIWLF